jgi:hypothetical protein
VPDCNNHCLGFVVFVLLSARAYVFALNSNIGSVCMYHSLYQIINHKKDH